MRKLLALLLAGTLIMSLAGCGASTGASNVSGSQPDASQAASGSGGTAAEGQTPGGSSVFRAAMTTNPLSLDEGYSSTTATRQVSSYVMETLFTFGDNYEVIPQLADSYEVSDDNLVYDIKLREGITFHDGSDLTSEDVVASFQRFKTTPLYPGSFDAVVNCEATGDYSVRFTLNTPIALLPLLAFPPRLIILPKEVCERTMDGELRIADYIGTGPYVLDEWTPDVHVKMSKFADYQVDSRYTEGSGLGGARNAYFDTLYLLPVPEAESRIAGLETGEFDFAEAIPNTSYDRISGNTDLVSSIVKPRWSIVVELNNGVWPTSDANFNKALVHALDMEKVLQAVTSGNKEFYRLDPSWYTPEQFYYSVAGSEGIYNVQDQAKVDEYLAAANYKGEEIVYLVNKDYDWMYKACLSMEEQWKAAGINIKLEFYDWASQIAKAQSLEGWNINQTGISPRLDPTQSVSSFSSSSLAAYGFANDKMDELLAEVSKGYSEEERIKYWEQIQELVWQELPSIKIGDYFELEAISGKYEGYESFYVIPRFWNVHPK